MKAPIVKDVAIRAKAPKKFALNDFLDEYLDTQQIDNLAIDSETEKQMELKNLLKIRTFDEI